MSLLGTAASIVQARALRGAVRLAPEWFEKRLYAYADQACDDILMPQGRLFARQMLRFAKDYLPRGCPSCRKKILENLVLGAVTSKRERAAYARRTGLAPPYCLVISPTMRCNLRCVGCYAARYTRIEEMSLGLVDRILREARSMGIRFITISGGEPFARPEILDLVEAHGDITFQFYTNGTLINDRMARRLADLGNITPCISVEGFEAETDARRGRGIYQKILAAMRHLREHGVYFGFSATATRLNNELIFSDAFVDFYRDQGCGVGWYFNYIPIGRDPNLALMPTPEQRLLRRRRLKELRARLPMLLMDFWNDGALVGGCMAAGRYYVHINVRGDVEPCVFAQFAVDNIRDKSLHEVLNSPFFRRIRHRQPYTDNHLKACMIIDHPHILREVVRRSGARPTYKGGGALLREAAADLDAYAAEWGALADAEWSAEGSADHEAAARERHDVDNAVHDSSCVPCSPTRT